MKKVFLSLAFLIVLSSLVAQNIVNWRGIERSGIYDEKGLLKEWPEKGPKLLWFTEELPVGYSTVSISGDKLFMTGLEDGNDVAVAVSTEGKILWKTVYGKAWNKSFPYSRIAPTIDGDKLYLSSGLGDVVCLNANDGKIVWKLEASKKFNGTYGKWGISEHLLIIDNMVLFTPGGEETTMVALNKLNGEVIWKSKSLKDNPSYVSPLLIERNNKELVVNVTENYVYGIQPEDGKILWTFDYGQYKDPIVRANIQTNTPVYSNGKLFITHGYNHKAVMLNISENLEEVKLAYIDSTLDVHHGGVVLLDGYIYGANWKHNRMGSWCCIEWETGKVKYKTIWENKGSIVSADGLLYCYEEKNGHIALVKPNPEKFDIISTFKIPYGKGPHWSHPVIYKGILYIRHGNALMAYDIKE